MTANLVAHLCLQQGPVKGKHSDGSSAMTNMDAEGAEAIDDDKAKAVRLACHRVPVFAPDEHPPPHLSVCFEGC
jgi:hypothetical protein